MIQTRYDVAFPRHSRRPERVAQDDILQKGNKAGSVVRPRQKNIQFRTVEPLGTASQNRKKFRKRPIPMEGQSVQERIRKGKNQTDPLKRNRKWRTETKPKC